MPSKLLAVLLALSVSVLPFNLPLAIAETLPTTIQVTSPNKSPEGSALSEDSARDLIQVTFSPIPLSSKLRKSYEAYQVQVFSE